MIITDAGYFISYTITKTVKKYVIYTQKLDSS